MNYLLWPSDKPDYTENELDCACTQYFDALCHHWWFHPPHSVSHVRHALRGSESCLTRHCVVSHMSTSHILHVNETYLTCQRVMFHMSTSHVSHVSESCPHLLYPGMRRTKGPIYYLNRQTHAETNFWQKEVETSTDETHHSVYIAGIYYCIPVNENAFLIVRTVKSYDLAHYAK